LFDIHTTIADVKFNILCRKTPKIRVCAPPIHPVFSYKRDGGVSPYQSGTLRDRVTWHV